MMEGDELPAGWATCTIGEGAEYVQRGKSPKYADQSSLSVINQKCVRWSGIEKEHARFIHEDQISKWDQVRYLQRGDLLWNSTGTGTIGRACLYAGEFKQAVVDSHITIVRADKRCLDPSYLRFFVMSPFVQMKFDEMQSGSTNQVELSKAAVTETNIPLAPLPEQQRIVEKIETLFAELDKGEEALREVQKLLTRYRQSVLKAAVTGTLTADWRAANGQGEWRDTTLGELNSLLTSGSRGWAKFYADEGDTFIRAQNLKHDRLDLDDVAFVALPDGSEGTRTRVLQGDILITITGANVTKTALVERVDGVAYVSQHVALFRPTNDAYPEFLHRFITAKAGGRMALEKAAYGAGKPGLNLQNIKDVPISLPPIDEQREIVDRLDHLLGAQSSIQTEIERQLASGQSLRQSILKDAFSGKLVPQDLSDEPADKLLERIRAARADKPKTKRKKAAA